MHAQLLFLVLPKLQNTRFLYLGRMSCIRQTQARAVSEQLVPRVFKTHSEVTQETVFNTTARYESRFYSFGMTSFGVIPLLLAQDALLKLACNDTVTLPGSAKQSRALQRD